MGKYIRKADHAPYGPLAKHGGYSVAHKDELVKRHPEIQLYLKVIRRGLIRDLSPEGEAHMTTASGLLLDRLMQKLATARIIESYLADHGILRRDKLEKDKVLDAEPVMTIWLALNTQISAATTLPAHAVNASVGTTWQGFSLSALSSAGAVTVFADVACFVAFAADGDVDGGAVSAPYKTLTATQAAAGYTLKIPAPNGQRSQFVLVAAAAGTASVEVVQEGA